MVKLLQGPVPGIVEDAGPEFFGFTGHHRLGVAADFVRAEAGMKASHDDRHAAPPVLAGDLVGAFGGVGLHAQRDEVGRFVEGDGFHPIIVETRGHVARGQPGQGRGGQRFHLPGAHVATITPPTADTRMDNGQFHTVAVAAAGMGAEGAWPMIQSQL